MIIETDFLSNVESNKISPLIFFEKSATISFTNSSSNRTNSGSSINNNNKKKWKHLANKDDSPIHGPVHEWKQCHQNQCGNNFRPHHTTNSNALHFTNPSVWSPMPQNNVPLPLPPAQVYFHQRNSDNGSHLSTPNNSNYIKTTPIDQTKNNQYNHTHYYISHNVQEPTEDDYLPEGTMSKKLLNDIPLSLFGLSLFDSDSTSTLINIHVVSPQAKAKLGSNKMVTLIQHTCPSIEYFNAAKISFRNSCKTRFVL